METLSSLNGLMIRQQKEWGEIITGFETKNKYVVSDMAGENLYMAAEEPGSVLLRWFLKALRPFTIAVLSKEGQILFKVRRPFRFYFHRAEIIDGNGNIIGSIERRFSILRRIYSVRDKAQREIFELFGPLLHPWTFEIRENGNECGKITKKWSGLLKEGFSDADNFGIMFPETQDVKRKMALLGAVFLIDFVHFENTGNN